MGFQSKCGKQMQRTLANRFNIYRIHGVTRPASSTNKQTGAVKVERSSKTTEGGERGKIRIVFHQANHTGEIHLTSEDIVKNYVTNRSLPKGDKMGEVIRGTVSNGEPMKQAENSSILLSKIKVVDRRRRDVYHRSLLLCPLPVKPTQPKE